MKFSLWNAEFFKLTFVTVFLTILCKCNAGRVKRQGWFGTKAPNATCLFNQCKSPGHCFNGGTCILDKTTCLAFCSCVNGFTGYRCETRISVESTIGSAYPSTRRSTVHDSDGITTTSATLETDYTVDDQTCSPNLNCEHGHCKLVFGKPHCICDRHWTGPLCDTLNCQSNCASYENCQMLNDIPTCVKKSNNISPKYIHVENMTLRPTTSRVCMQTFECIHGYCEKSESAFRCVCDENWIGLFCDRFKCPSYCEPDFDCILTNDTYQCVKGNDAEQTTLIYPNDVSENMTIPEIDDNLMLDVCSESYTKRPEKERSCYDKICGYGRCEAAALVFRCICDQNATGPMCEFKCCKACGIHGRCTVNSTGGVECVCLTEEYQGDFCNMTKDGNDLIFLNTSEKLSSTTEIPRTETSKWYFWLFGVCAVVLLLLIVCLIVIPYLLWRHQVAWVMEIVYLFQPYENNDSMSWDVFLWRSAGDDEELILVKTIESHLVENFGLKVYPDSKVVSPWKQRQDTILRAIYESRRVLICLTPKFIKTEWCRLEDTVVKKLISMSKNRIIFVVLKDYCQTINIMDKNLQILIKSTAKMTFTRELNRKNENIFWRKMKFLLPKLETTKSTQNGDKNESTYRHAIDINEQVTEKNTCV